MKLKETKCPICGKKIDESETKYYCTKKFFNKLLKLAGKKMPGGFTYIFNNKANKKVQVVEICKNCNDILTEETGVVFSVTRSA